MKILFTKLHGAENDFLLTWADQLPPLDFPSVTQKICARTTGIGADGWMLVWKEPRGVRTRLFNSDGSEPELSGNGTRCAAAFALLNGVVAGPEIIVRTQAGPKVLRLLSRSGNKFVFEMEMGIPSLEKLHATMEVLGSSYDSTLVNVGNPQCVVFPDTTPGDWRAVGAAIESDLRFPNRTNVSFVQVVDRHTLEVLFFERGAGETRSSGTGSTGAAVASIWRKLVDSPVTIHTPAGALELRWDDSVFLTGPAELVAEGTYYLDSADA